MHITASFCAFGDVCFSFDFSQVIIEVRICHPQNEMKMNLQSQMQIYLLRKRERKEKQREEGYVNQSEETMNNVSKSEDRTRREGWAVG